MLLWPYERGIAANLRCDGVSHAGTPYGGPPGGLSGRGAGAPTDGSASVGRTWRLVERWPDWFPTDPVADPQQELDELLGAVIAQSNHLHHPCYVGHQVTAPMPQAALWEMAGTLLNNAMPVYEMGPVATAMERNLVRWMGVQLGYDRLACAGVITSGGSAGNLTALLAARQDRAGFDVWTEAPGKGSRCAYWLGKAPTTVCSVRYRSWGGGQRA